MSPTLVKTLVRRHKHTHSFIVKLADFYSELGNEEEVKLVHRKTPAMIKLLFRHSEMYCIADDKLERQQILGFSISLVVDQF